MATITMNISTGNELFFFISICSPGFMRLAVYNDLYLRFTRDCSLRFQDVSVGVGRPALNVASPPCQATRWLERVPWTGIVKMFPKLGASRRGRVEKRSFHELF